MSLVDFGIFYKSKEKELEEKTKELSKCIENLSLQNLSADASNQKEVKEAEKKLVNIEESLKKLKLEIEASKKQRDLNEEQLDKEQKIKKKLSDVSLKLKHWVVEYLSVKKKELKDKIEVKLNFELGFNKKKSEMEVAYKSMKTQLNECISIARIKRNNFKTKLEKQKLKKNEQQLRKEQEKEAIAKDNKQIEETVILATPKKVKKPEPVTLTPNRRSRRLQLLSTEKKVKVKKDETKISMTPLKREIEVIREVSHIDTVKTATTTEGHTLILKQQRTKRDFLLSSTRKKRGRRHKRKLVQQEDMLDIFSDDIFA